MIRMGILPISVVLLAASGYLHAQTPEQDAERCSRGLGALITTVCSNSKSKLSSFSDCSYTCERNDGNGKFTRTTYYLPSGWPCGKCMECCGGTCKHIQFEIKNGLTLKSCAN
uniref:Putative ixostatin n=1 Tax=Ixodes ricinus TaxID=34613 RepID=A0A0K8RE36_IXORI